MTTTTMDNGTTDAAVRPRRSLEELVDRLFEAMGLGETPQDDAAQGAVRAIHQSRRLRQQGEIDGALAVLAEAKTASAPAHQARWAYAEWAQLVRRRCVGREVLVYGQGPGRAAALVPAGDGATLEVAAVLGMRWRPGKAVSRRSLRGLRPLGGCA